jgi:hypothetical protein
MLVEESIRRSARRVFPFVDPSFVYNDYEEVRPNLTAVLETSVHSGGSNHIEDSPKDEDFVATMLLMIKREDQPTSSEDADIDKSPVRRFEFLSQTCEEHKLKHATCPASCPQRRLRRVPRLKYRKENTDLDDVDDSSELEELHGSCISNGPEYSSDEVFEEINYQNRGHKICPTGATSVVKTIRSKKLSKGDVDEAYPNRRTRGIKRKPFVAESDSDLHTERYSKQRKLVSGLELIWNPPTDSYCLQKPRTTDQYTSVVSWSLSQLPQKRGTIEDVFGTLKENGWPELKKGNSREANSTKNFISKLLREQFVEQTHNERGEPVYSLTESVEEPEAEQDSLDSRFDEAEISPPVHRKKGASNSSRKATAKDSGRGRRWVRFACEKHRKEHARCPDNCAMRKKSYNNDDNTSRDDMEEDTSEVDDSKSQDGEIIIDELSNDM